MSMTRAQAVESASGKGLVRFRMDEDLKAQAEHALEQMGLSMANVMTMLSRRIVAEGKLPFEIYAVSTPLELTERAVMEGRIIMNNRKTRFGSVEEFFDELEQGAGDRQ